MSHCPSHMISVTFKFFRCVLYSYIFIIKMSNFYFEIILNVWKSCKNSKNNYNKIIIILISYDFNEDQMS